MLSFPFRPQVPVARAEFGWCHLIWTGSLSGRVPPSLWYWPEGKQDWSSFGVSGLVDSSGRREGISVACRNLVGLGRETCLGQVPHSRYFLASTQHHPQHSSPHIPLISSSSHEPLRQLELCFDVHGISYETYGPLKSGA